MCLFLAAEEKALLIHDAVLVSTCSPADTMLVFKDKFKHGIDKYRTQEVSISLNVQAPVSINQILLTSRWLKIIVEYNYHKTI